MVYCAAAVMRRSGPPHFRRGPSALYRRAPDLNAMSLRSTLELLRTSPEYERLLAAARADSGPVQVEGLAGVAKTCVAAALSAHTDRKALIITASQENAERIAGDLAAFGLLPGEVGLYSQGEAELDPLLVHGKVLASSLTPERKALARGRLSVLEALESGEVRIVVAPVEAALRETIGPLAGYTIELRRGATLDLAATAHRLVELGYERVPLVESACQFALRGGLLDLWPSTGDAPFRVELYGDEVESIRAFDAESQRSTGSVDLVRLLPATELVARASSVHETHTLLEHLPAGSLLVLDEPSHIRAAWLDTRERRRPSGGAEDRGEVSALPPGIDFEELLRRAPRFRLVLFTLLSHSVPWLRKLLDSGERVVINSGVVDALPGEMSELAGRVRTWMAAGNAVVVASDRPHRVTELLVEQGVPATAEAGPPRRPGEEVATEPLTPCAPGGGEAEVPAGAHRGPAPVRAVHGRLSAGFRLPGIKLLVLSDTELFGTGPERRRARASDRHQRRFKDSRPILSLLELREGDLVVHVTHGIGRYRGLVKRTVGGVEREFLRLDYQEPDRLFVPSDQLDRVQRYIGSDDAPPSIHRLGGAEWARTKARVRGKVREMAEELLKLYAARRAAPGHAFQEDSIWQEEMEAAFPYRETRDQLAAIEDTKRDMEAPRPMDRLVCGDVGYGKTEVAIRAAFKAVQEGKQVAVLVPTTVLAQQHFHTFSERLAAFPVRVELLSRFRSRQEIKAAVQGIADGVVDIAIGTHRLLSRDVQFLELGLLIIDEEQRFGVAHKERLKQLRATVDVLTLTATPIPRTLHMSLAGIRDMSVIEEPPEGRLAVRTYCLEADDAVIREAVLRELDRGGQVYYVHNRVETIYREADRLQRLVPQARLRVGHGQMRDTELEDVMVSFYEGEFDILVCTTIIESGLDIPNVNTILIHDADRLGLAQLHQLRGRVGRSARQAYCYLLYQPFKQISETAEKRLDAIREFTDLGAGFRIAMRDMEIRGAGNLLGGEQHGNMAAVGFDLYCQMIEEAVRELQGQPVEEQHLPSVTLPVSTLIPEGYAPTEGLRLAIYKKIAACRTHDDVARLQEELEDRFGDPPRTVWNMLALMRLRIDCVPAGVARIETDRDRVILWLARRVEKDEWRELARHNRRLQFEGDRMVLYFDGENPLRPVEQMVALLRKRGGEKAAAAVRRQLLAASAAEAMAGAR